MTCGVKWLKGKQLKVADVEESFIVTVEVGKIRVIAIVVAYAVGEEDTKKGFGKSERNEVKEKNLHEAKKLTSVRQLSSVFIDLWTLYIFDVRTCSVEGVTEQKNCSQKQESRALRRGGFLLFATHDSRNVAQQLPGRIQLRNSDDLSQKRHLLSCFVQMFG